jgi:hypothetical protein
MRIHSYHDLEFASWPSEYDYPHPCKYSELDLLHTTFQDDPESLARYISQIDGRTRWCHQDDHTRKGCSYHLFKSACGLLFWYIEMHFKGFSAEVAEKYSMQRQTRPTHQSDNYIFLQNPLLNLLFSLHFCIFKTRYFFHILKKCPDMASVAVAQPDIKITVHWHVVIGGFLDWYHV